VSNTGWTPAVPGQTNDIASVSDVDEFDSDEIVLADGDAVPDQVIDVASNATATSRWCGSAVRSTC